MTGYFFRVQRGDKHLNLRIEDMTPEERQAALLKYEKDALIRVIDRFCEVINNITNSP